MKKNDVKWHTFNCHVWIWGIFPWAAGEMEFCPTGVGLRASCGPAQQNQCKPPQNLGGCRAKPFLDRCHEQGGGSSWEQGVFCCSGSDRMHRRAGVNGFHSGGSGLLCVLRLRLLSCCSTFTLTRQSVSIAAERVVYAALSNIHGVMGCAEDPGIIGEMSGSELAVCLSG